MSLVRGIVNLLGTIIGIVIVFGIFIVLGTLITGGTEQLLIIFEKVTQELSFFFNQTISSL